MFVIHDINNLRDLRLYIHETDNMFHFVNAENVHQTILVRLPPAYVQQFAQTITFLLSENAHKALRNIENQAIALLFADAPQNIRHSMGSIINTRPHPSLSVAEHTPLSNTFVEAIISIDGILKTENSFEFVYHTIQMRKMVGPMPPTLDIDKLKSIDLFDLKTVLVKNENDSSQTQSLGEGSASA